MTTFIDFARAHGVLIQQLPPVGVWRRYPTEDKPRHRNGAIRYLESHGFVQNWATMDGIALWKSDADSPVAQQRARQVVQQAEREVSQARAKAAQRAAWVLGQCNTRTHAYATAKGFPEAVLNVWSRDGEDIAVIPMRVGRDLVGCQLINAEGEKKFLPGQRSSDAEFVIDNRGPHVLCEGYATALSAQRALRNLKRKYTLHVTFSAGNMKKVAARLPGGVVLADNDASGTGERAAREIGWPYWMSDAVDEDANDFDVRCGSFALAQGLAKVLREARA